MIQIKLKKSELMFDIKDKSHLETAQIEDVTARYRIENGTEKQDEIERCLTECIARLTKLVFRYLKKAYVIEADDLLNIPEQYVFDFDLTEREGTGKAQAMADLMHDYIVSYTLAKFYASVSAGDLSNSRSALAMAAGNEITELLFTKAAPVSDYDTSVL